MADYPRIQRGLGNLTPRTFNQAMSQLEELSNTKAPGTQILPQGNARPFLARLIGAQNLRLIDSYSGEPLGFRWLYSWREVELEWDRDTTSCTPNGRRVDVRDKLNPDGSYYRTGDIGTDYTDCTAAVNLNEMFNDSDSRMVGPGFVMGANTEALPIGNVNESNEQIVLMYSFSYPRKLNDDACTDTDTFYFFTQDNPLSCDTSSFRASTFTFVNDLGSDWGVLRDYDVDLGAFT